MKSIKFKDIEEKRKFRVFMAFINEDLKHESNLFNDLCKSEKSNLEKLFLYCFRRKNAPNEKDRDLIIDLVFKYLNKLNEFKYLRFEGNKKVFSNKAKYFLTSLTTKPKKEQKRLFKLTEEEKEFLYGG